MQTKTLREINSVVSAFSGAFRLGTVDLCTMLNHENVFFGFRGNQNRFSIRRRSVSVLRVTECHTYYRNVALVTEAFRFENR